MSLFSVKHIAPITLLALLAILSWWLKDSASPERNSIDDNIRHDPDYYAENLVTYSMDKTGNIYFQLKVKHIEHYPDDDSLTLLKPEITIYKDQQAQWTISSENGVVSANGDEVVLSNSVIAIQSMIHSTTKSTRHSTTGNTNNDANKQARGLILTTEKLVIKPTLKFAETELDVRLQDANGSTLATGLKVDMENNIIQLLSNVKGSYFTP